MKTEVVNITPSKAKKWLEDAKDFQNRHVAKRHVDFLAGQMLSGEWKLNGETIKFNNGTVIDGQHRLMACVQAGIPFASYVAYDVPKDVFTTIDTGRRRAQSDVLSMLGHSSATRLASALQWLNRLKVGTMRLRASNTEIVRLRDEYPGIDGGKGYAERLMKFIPPSPAMALYYLFAEKSKEEADDFFEKFASGVNLSKTSPVLRLRELLTATDKVKRLRITERIAMVVKAWNLCRNKKPAGLRSLSIKEGEAFPKIV